MTSTSCVAASIWSSGSSRPRVGEPRYRRAAWLPRSGLRVRAVCAWGNQQIELIVTAGAASGRNLHERGQPGRTRSRGEGEQGEQGRQTKIGGQIGSQRRPNQSVHERLPNSHHRSLVAMAAAWSGCSGQCFVIAARHITCSPWFFDMVFGAALSQSLFRYDLPNALYPRSYIWRNGIKYPC
jgi:hypothetical protein